MIATEDEVVVETYVADRGYLLDPLGEVYVLGTGLQVTRGVVVRQDDRRGIERDSGSQDESQIGYSVADAS